MAFSTLPDSASLIDCASGGRAISGMIRLQAALPNLIELSENFLAGDSESIPSQVS